MAKVEFTKRFRDAYSELPNDKVKEKVKKAIRLLVENPRHPSLRSKPVQGAKGIYEASADMNYRLTYERLPDDVLRLRVVGKHDDMLKKP